jgi:CRP-like cAMP-binding protein
VPAVPGRMNRIDLQIFIFLSLLEDPQVCRWLLATTARRCDDAWSQMEVIGCTYVREKVRTGLRWLSERIGVETSRGVRIDLSQTQLARMIGCARETLSREVNELKRMSAVDICYDNGRKSFFVLNPDTLKESI